MWSGPFQSVWIFWFLRCSDDICFNFAARHIWCVIPDYFVEGIIFSHIMAQLGQRNVYADESQTEDKQNQNGRNAFWIEYFQRLECKHSVSDVATEVKGHVAQPVEQTKSRGCQQNHQVEIFLRCGIALELSDKETFAQ